MPIVTFDLVDDGDFVDITCSPKALGSGRCAALAIFSFPDLHTIEKFVLETVVRAGSQPCPPVVIGVGTGGDSTAMAVHVDCAAGHGFTPVAVAFNCWINRRTRARLYNDGRVQTID